MRVTPTVRCIAKIFSVVAAAFSLAFISCAANDDSASLTIQMPGSSSSRAISSEGHLLGEGAELELNYSVYIRNSDNEEVEKYTNVAPGTKLTISALRAGSYKVAIRGSTEGSVMFYGAADALVQGGTENTVGIQLEAFDGISGRVNFDTNIVDPSCHIDVRIKGENGDSATRNFLIVQEGAPRDSGFGNFCEIDNFFFEPGFKYYVDVSILNTDGDLLDTRTISATATKNGIVFTVN